jgi:hypothetical protein
MRRGVNVVKGLVLTNPPEDEKHGFVPMRNQWHKLKMGENRIGDISWRRSLS